MRQPGLWVHEDCQLAAGTLRQWLGRPQLLASLMTCARTTHRQKSAVMYSLAAARNGIARSRFEALAQQPWYTISALTSVAHSNVAVNSTNVYKPTQCFILTSCICAKQTGRGDKEPNCLQKRKQRRLDVAVNEQT